jgi:hypothetical protein
VTVRLASVRVSSVWYASPDCPELPFEFLLWEASSSNSPCKSSSSGCSFRLFARSLPTLRFLSGILAPSSWYGLFCSFDWLRRGVAAERECVARGSSSSRSSSRSESESGAFGWWYSCGVVMLREGAWGLAEVIRSVCGYNHDMCGCMKTLGGLAGWFRGSAAQGAH